MSLALSGMSRGHKAPMNAGVLSGRHSVAVQQNDMGQHEASCMRPRRRACPGRSQ